MSTDAVSVDLDEVQASLDAVMPKRFGARVDRTLISREDTVYPYSRVRRLRFQVGDGRLDVFLKRVVPLRGPIAPVRARLQCEGDLLLQLNQSMPGRVAPFIALFEHQLTLVTEGCRGDQLDQVLGRASLGLLWPKRRRRLVAIAKRCGEWLDQFHLLTRKSHGDLSSWLAFQSGEAEWRIRELVELDPRNRGLYLACATRFDRDLAACRLSDPGCTTHGDYAPHNIFADSNGEIQVLDFYAAREAHPLADVVNFVGKIASLAESLSFPSSAAREFCAGFLRGYRELDPSELSLLRLLLVLQTMKRMLVLHSNRRSRPAFLPTDACRRWYVPHLESYVSNHPGRPAALWPWPFLPPSITAR